MNLNLYVVKHKVLEAIVWWISTHTGSVTGCLGCRVIWLSSPTAPHLSESKESGQGWQQFPGRNSGIGEEQREQASPSSVVQVYCQGGSIDCLVPTYCHLSKLASFQDSELGGQRQWWHAAFQALFHTVLWTSWCVDKMVYFLLIIRESRGPVFPFTCQVSQTSSWTFHVTGLVVPRCAVLPPEAPAELLFIKWLP